MTHVQHNSKNDEWYTPAHILEAARRVLGGPFDLDPASCPTANQVVGASRFFTKETNGLLCPWHAERLWLNPPYSRELYPLFVEKLLEEIAARRVLRAAVLVNNATETVMGQKLLKQADCVQFLSRRVRFLDESLSPKKTPLQGQMLCFFNPSTTPDWTLGVWR
jgi:phage N-6-adenine-methyltransferase